MKDEANYKRLNVNVHMQTGSLRIGFKVPIVYGLNQLFCNFYNFLFASYNKKIYKQ